MKKTRILVLITALISMSFTNPTAITKNNFTVDVNKSMLTWKGYKPTGSHHGTIALQSGNLIMEEGKVTGGFFTVNMATINDADGSKKLEGHLKSKDFFEIEVYPTATFQITKSENKEGKTYITGNITIKNVTKEITFIATISETEETVTLTSETFHINRATFNIKYKSKSFFNNLKEKFINNVFDLQVTIVAKK